MGSVSTKPNVAAVGTNNDGRTPNKIHSSATLSVFFEGTANRLDYHVTQVGLFAELTEAVNLRLFPGATSVDHQYKMGFDGCGVTNGNMGVIFATGLTDQCNDVCAAVATLLNLYSAVTINVLGLSRGGIAGIYLAQMLGHYREDIIQTNLLLFDPVPGNLITASKFVDILGLSTANSAMLLNQCQNLGYILALYPYLPLPDLAFHAPVFPTYPAHVTIEEDAVLGCHQGALFCQKSRESLLSFSRIKQWLLKCGTKLGNNDQAKRLDRTLLQCKEMMDDEMTLLNVPAIQRYAHSYPSGTIIVRHDAGKALYLNKWHETLTAEYRSESTRPAAMPATEEGTTHLYLLEIKHPP